MSAHLSQLPLPKKVEAVKAAHSGKSKESVKVATPKKQTTTSIGLIELSTADSKPTAKIETSHLEIALNEEPQTFEQRIAAWCRASWGWMTSMAIHLLLVLFLGLMTLAVHQFNNSTTLVVDDGTMDAEEVVPALMTDLITPELAASGSSSAATDAEAAIPGGGEVFAPLSLIGTESPGSGSGEGSQTGPTSDIAALLKMENFELANQGDGDSQKDKGSDSGQAEFFGIQASGRNFVFVVDSSGSMSGQKWRRACKELVQSIERLGPEQTFCVYFFDAVPHLMFNKRHDELVMLEPTKENITKLKRWMISIKLGNATMPLPATRMALAMKPDAVFLLSDGEFQDDTPTFLRLSNVERDEDGARPKTIVHTICFKSFAGAGTLKMVADENGGIYRFVK